MSADKLSRRELIQVGLGAAATTGLVSVAGVATAKADWNNGSPVDGDQFRNALDNSYSFLDTMMDAYATGSTVRLTQSYADQIGLISSAFVYDNALAIMAYLIRGRGDDIARALTLGDGLLYAQTHDPEFLRRPRAPGILCELRRREWSLRQTRTRPLLFHRKCGWRYGLDRHGSGAVVPRHGTEKVSRNSHNRRNWAGELHPGKFLRHTRRGWL